MASARQVLLLIYMLVEIFWQTVDGFVPAAIMGCISTPTEVDGI